MVAAGRHKSNWKDWVTQMSSTISSMGITRRVGERALIRTAELAWSARSPLRQLGEELGADHINKMAKVK